MPDIAALTLAVNSAPGVRGVRQMNSALDALDRRGNSAVRLMNALGRSMRRLGTRLTLGVTTPTLFGAINFTKLASDADESVSAMTRVFETARTSAADVARTVADEFDQSFVTVAEQLKSTGDLLTGFGVDAETALNQAAQASRIAADLASFQNIKDVSTVLEAINKGLIGETEALKRYGIAIRQSSKEWTEGLKTLMEVQGLTLNQARAQMALNTIMEQSVNAIGDYRRTADAFANRLRALAERWKDLRIAIGQTLLPIATKLLNRLISGIERFTKWWRQLTPQVQRALLLAAGIAAALGPALIIAGMLVGLFAKIVAAVAFIGTLGLPAIVGIIATIAAAVAGLVVLWRRFGDRINRTSITAFANKVLGFFANWRENWAMIRVAAAQTWAAIVEFARAAWRELVDVILPQWRKILSTMISNMWQNIKVISAIIGAVIGATFSWIVDRFDRALALMLKSIRNWGSRIVNGGAAIGKALFDAIKQGIRGNLDAANIIAAEFVRNFGRVDIPVGVSLGDRLSEAIEGAKDRAGGFVSLFDGLEDTFAGLVELWEKFKSQIPGIPAFVTQFEQTINDLKAKLDSTAAATADGGETAARVSSERAEAFRYGSQEAFRLIAGRDEKALQESRANRKANESAASTLRQISTRGVPLAGILEIGSFSRAT